MNKTTTPTLSALAEENIRLFEFDLDAIRAAWARGDYGDLHDYETGTKVRSATAAEALESWEAEGVGAFDVDGRTVYVLP